MIVKLVHYLDESTPSGHQEVYECTNYEVIRTPTHLPDLLYLNGGSICISFDNVITNMYVMNSNGKTIEHFRFSYEETEALSKV